MKNMESVRSPKHAVTNLAIGYPISSARRWKTFSINAQVAIGTRARDPVLCPLPPSIRLYTSLNPYTASLWRLRGLMSPLILFRCDFHNFLFSPNLMLVGFVETEKLSDCRHVFTELHLPLSLLPASFIPSPILSKRLLANDHCSICKEPEHDLIGNPQSAQTEDHNITYLVNLFLELLYIEQSRLTVCYLLGYN